MIENHEIAVIAIASKKGGQHRSDYSLCRNRQDQRAKKKRNFGAIAYPQSFKNNGKKQIKNDFDAQRPTGPNKSFHVSGGEIKQETDVKQQLSPGRKL